MNPSSGRRRRSARQPPAPAPPAGRPLLLGLSCPIARCETPWRPSGIHSAVQARDPEDGTTVRIHRLLVTVQLVSADLDHARGMLLPADAVLQRSSPTGNAAFRFCNDSIAARLYTPWVNEQALHGASLGRTANGHTVLAFLVNHSKIHVWRVLVVPYSLSFPSIHMCNLRVQQDLQKPIMLQQQCSRWHHVSQSGWVKS